MVLPLNLSEKTMPRATYAWCELDRDVFIVLKKLGYQPRTIYDVGAAGGWWSHEIHKVLAEAEYHLFEPLVDFSPKYKTDLTENLKLHPFFTLHKFALGDKTGEIVINIFPEIMGSTALENPYGYPDTRKRISVKEFSLDDAIKSFNLPVPQIIKIDTQGFELSILKGAQRTLPYVDVLLLECFMYRAYGENCPLMTEIVSWLNHCDFHLWDFADCERTDDGILQSQDCVFINRKFKLLPNYYNL